MSKIIVIGAHVAAVPMFHIQLCERCGTQLLDNRGVQTIGGKPPRFFVEGTAVEKTASGVGALSAHICSISFCDCNAQSRSTDDAPIPPL